MWIDQVRDRWRYIDQEQRKKMAMIGGTAALFILAATLLFRGLFGAGDWSAIPDTTLTQNEQVVEQLQQAAAALPPPPPDPEPLPEGTTGGGKVILRQPGD